MTKEPITLEGYEKLKREIQRLKTVERPATIKAIAAARAHGDLKENAEYHAAREEQGFLEARIAELEHMLALAQVVDHKAIKTDNIAFGATITLLDLQTDTRRTYQIVGKFESDVKSGKIPIASPIARALIGKKVGDEVTIQVPKGTQEFEVLKVEYV